MNKFKTMKVFDCQDMPQDLQKKFFDRERAGLDRGNDVYIAWWIGAGSDDDLTSNLIDQWLIANGAEAPKDENSHGERVLIKHWW